MGTSKDYGGKPSNSPLVPPHADAYPDQTLPNPKKKRFRNFRMNFSDYIKTGSQQNRQRMLRLYVSEASGGSAIGFRKFGAVARSGASAISALSNIRVADPDLQSAIGQPIDAAAQIIANIVAPFDENRDTVLFALQDAFCSALHGYNEFEPQNMSEELLIDVLLNYITESILIDVWNESGKQLDNFSSSDDLLSRENELRTIIRAAVDFELAERIDRSLENLSAKKLEELQLDSIRAVFEIWEDYPE